MIKLTGNILIWSSFIK